MRIKHPAVQVAVFVVASMLVAVIANGFAGRTRRLVLPGWYPNALRVPPREVPAPATITTTTPAATATSAAATTTAVGTTTTAQSPAPGQPPIVIPTATIERPAGDPAREAGVPATGQPPATRPPANPAAVLARFTPHPDKAYIEITGDDAAALYAAGALFLDARRTSVYEDGHIAGARSFSVWEADIDDKVGALFEERSDPAEQSKPIVIYCSGGACEDSHMLSQKLWLVQFNNVYVYKDGFPDWQKRGLPVRTGATP